MGEDTSFEREKRSKKRGKNLIEELYAHMYFSILV